jgi:hypothetical protein
MALMLSFYTPGKGRIETVKAGETLPAEVNWIDALRPTGEEIAFLRRALGIQVPTLQTLSEIESSSKFRKEEDWLYLSVPVIYEKEGFLPALTPLGFAVQERAFDGAFQVIKSLSSIAGQSFPLSGRSWRAGRINWGPRIARQASRGRS